MKEMELRSENGVLLGILRNTTDGIFLEGKNGKKFGTIPADKIIDCINQMKSTAQ